MLMRSAARRTAALLMIALVAMLLVATGGSARGSQHRVSAGTGQAVAAPHTGRQVDIPAPAQHDQTSHLLDLTSTPPTTDDSVRTSTVVAADAHPASYVDADGVTPTGRAPPAP